MLSNLLVHPRTLLGLEAFLNKPSHGLLLIGPSGSGKKSLALTLAVQLLNLDAMKIESYPYLLLIEPLDSSISIDKIRELQKFMTLKTTGSQKIIKRIVVICDAENMGIEAQNSFLKTLEEPPEDTCLILTVNNKDNILPTVVSRCQTIEVLPVGKQEAMNFFETRGFKSSDINKYYALSQGQPGLLASLLSDSDHSLKVSVESAKQILKSTLSERLTLADSLISNKANLPEVLNALKRIIEAALVTAAKQNSAAEVKKCHSSLKVIQETERAIKNSASPKLTVDNLLLNL